MKERNIKYEKCDIETVDGLAEASFHDIFSVPAIMVENRRRPILSDEEFNRLIGEEV